MQPDAGGANASRWRLAWPAIIRERKFEFDAWLVFEAGKTWPEAEADVAEAIDFCEYYARQMQRLAAPEAGGADCRASATRWSICRWAWAS